MSLNKFLEKIKTNHFVSFSETIDAITEHYHYHPTEFSNGLGENKLTNNAGTNEGSCKIFAFAQLHQLTPEQTLNLFGDYYRKEVIEDPSGNNHQNIRNFIAYGWDGISFNGQALTPKDSE